MMDAEKLHVCVMYRMEVAAAFVLNVGVRK